MAQSREERGKVAARARRLLPLLQTFCHDRRGTTAIEYGMIGFLVFAVAAGAMRLYGSKLNGVYSNIGTTISQVQ